MNTLAVGVDALLTIELDSGNGLNPTLYLSGSFGGSASASGSTIRGIAVRSPSRCPRTGT